MIFWVDNLDRQFALALLGGIIWNGDGQVAVPIGGGKLFGVSLESREQDSGAEKQKRCQ
jgi:hypothetical protein